MKKTTKSAFHRGFTLIELMIVIVILGILMGTILPRLTGAQARARDTGRIADLNAIGQALETYFDDNGQYPNPGDLAAGTAFCMKDAPHADDTGKDGVDVMANISSYLKGGVVPTPAESQRTQYNTAADICVGSYVYIPLKSRGIANNGYALISDVETFQKANVLASAFATVSDTTHVGTAIKTTTRSVLEAAESGSAADAGKTVYVVYN